jgi:hypothetical protein
MTMHVNWKFDLFSQLDATDVSRKTIIGDQTTLVKNKFLARSIDTITTKYGFFYLEGLSAIGYDS